VKDFGSWFKEIGKEIGEQVASPSSVDSEAFSELMAYNHPDDESFVYPCRSCGESTDVECDPEEFDPDYHYCGKDQYCMP
jgi:hypothetical protein